MVRGDEFVSLVLAVVVGGVVVDEEGVAVVGDVVGSVEVGVDDDGKGAYGAILHGNDTYV